MAHEFLVEGMRSPIPGTSSQTETKDINISEGEIKGSKSNMIRVNRAKEYIESRYMTKDIDKIIRREDGIDPNKKTWILLKQKISKNKASGNIGERTEHECKHIDLDGSSSVQSTIQKLKDKLKSKISLITSTLQSSEIKQNETSSRKAKGKYIDLYNNKRYILDSTGHVETPSISKTDVDSKDNSLSQDGDGLSIIEITTASNSSVDTVKTQISDESINSLSYGGISEGFYSEIYTSNEEYKVFLENLFILRNNQNLIMSSLVSMLNRESTEHQKQEKTEIVLKTSRNFGSGSPDNASKPLFQNTPKENLLRHNDNALYWGLHNSIESVSNILDSSLYPLIEKERDFLTFLEECRDSKSHHEDRSQLINLENTLMSLNTQYKNIMTKIDELTKDEDEIFQDIRTFIENVDHSTRKLIPKMTNKIKRIHILSKKYNLFDKSEFGSQSGGLNFNTRELLYLALSWVLSIVLHIIWLLSSIKRFLEDIV